MHFVQSERLSNGLRKGLAQLYHEQIMNAVSVKQLKHRKACFVQL